MKTTIVIHTCSPITTTSPASNFWGIDQSVEYGTTTILNTTAGIVDTGKWKLSYNILADGSKVLYHSRNHIHPYCHGCIHQVPVRYRGCSRQCDWTASHYRHTILGSAESVLHSWWCTYIPSSLSIKIPINFNFSPTDYLWADPQCSNLAPFPQHPDRWYYWQHLPDRRRSRYELRSRFRLHQRYDLPPALLFRLRYRQ